MKHNTYMNDMLHLKVHLCFNQEQFDDLLKHYKVKEPTDWCKSGVAQVKSLITPSGAQVQIMSINKKGKTKKDLLATLVHESVHVWQWHKQYIGEIADCWEIEAYFIDEIFTVFLPKVIGQLKG
ncbi:MAG: hypothetical protein EOM35_02310 [Negativicutes bacterium]|nr:hypothetical protein [Negativicutes bacterium]